MQLPRAGTQNAPRGWGQRRGALLENKVGGDRLSHR